MIFGQVTNDTWKIHSPMQLFPPITRNGAYKKDAYE